ncbi:S1 family peptidase [Allofranklinella schreckenbergeri]|uniref:S1 family peptidase n=1 Tax=Allofranklinella schreckenbergeri TaxID=1076744 RepID=UPI0011C40256|nr:S1 family peptidase [Allofranklinella schreckenbergeri]
MKKWLCAFGLMAGVAVAADNPNAKYIEHAQRLSEAGVDLMEIGENAKIMEKISHGEQKLKEVLGLHYAGDWLGYDEKGSVYHVVAVTDLKAKGKVQVDYPIEFVLAKNSMSYLEGVMKRLEDIFKENKDDWLINTFYIEPIVSKVIVGGELKNRERIMNFLEENGFSSDVIDFEGRDGVTLYRSLTAGEKIKISSPGSSAGGVCTSGFNAKIGIYDVALTAGHCAGNASMQHVYFYDYGVPSNSSFIGEYVINKFSSGLDAALFVNANWSHDFLPRYYTGYNWSTAVRGVANAQKHSQVCSYGAFSGWRCGIVKSVNAIHIVGGGNSMLFNEAFFCATPGDSGGPVVLGKKAAGIFSGAVGNYPNGTCGPTVGGGSFAPISIFQPIVPVIDSIPGLTIKTL